MGVVVDTRHRNQDEQTRRHQTTTRRSKERIVIQKKAGNIHNTNKWKSEQTHEGRQH